MNYSYRLEIKQLDGDSINYYWYIINNETEDCIDCGSELSFLEAVSSGRETFRRLSISNIIN